MQRLSDMDRISYPLKDPQVTSWWCTFPAHVFGPEMRHHLVDVLDCYYATNSVLQQALRGDAASAVHLALRTRRDATITARTDLVMTALMRCALDGSAGAALVLSHVLRALPLEDRSGARLGVSWLAHNLASALSKPSRHKASEAFPSRNGALALSWRTKAARDDADVGVPS